MKPIGGPFTAPISKSWLGTGSLSSKNPIPGFFVRLNLLFYINLRALVVDSKFDTQLWVCPKRISEHNQVYLHKGMVKNINSWILRLVDSGHQVEPTTAYKSVLAITRFRTRRLSRPLLMATEAIAIRPMRPKLCKQRNFMQMIWLSLTLYITNLSVLYTILVLSLVHPFIFLTFLTPAFFFLSNFIISH